MQLESILQRVRRRLAPRGYGASWAWASLLVVPLGLVLFDTLVGLRVEHYASAALFLTLAWAGPRARRFSAISAPFALVGMSYDLMPYFLPLRGEIHVADLWHLERLLFPAPGGASWGDVISDHTAPALDLLAGLAYITYLFEVFLLAAWFYVRKGTARAQRLALSFGLLNVLGWSIWILWPAAPPWYVDVHGLGPAVLDAAPSAAGAARFDALVGHPIFSSFYSRSTNVFGALPSLHAGYAALAASVAWSFGRGTRAVTCAYALLMAFSAVYLRHHYLLDVICGVVIALVSDRLTLFCLASVRAEDAAPAPTAALATAGSIEAPPAARTFS